MATVRVGRRGRKVQTSCCHRFDKKKALRERRKGFKEKKFKIKNRQIKMVKKFQGKGEKVRKRKEEEEARLHSNSSVLSSRRS